MTNKTILLVEDSEADQFLFKMLVEGAYPDIAIVTAFDGQQAYELLTTMQVEPSLIFLDINMPRMNGYEFLDIAQGIIANNNIRVFMLTSSIRELDKDQAFRYDGVKDFIEKPLKIDRLQSIMGLWRGFITYLKKHLAKPLLSSTQEKPPYGNFPCANNNYLIFFRIRSARLSAAGWLDNKSFEPPRLANFSKAVTRPYVL